MLVVVKAPGMAPEEVEARISFPIEMEMQGLPRQTVLRSTTKYALSSIIIDFEDGTDIYWARTQVAERLNQVWGALPAGVEGGLAPITTPLGEIYMYRIVGEGYSNQELRALQELFWIEAFPRAGTRIWTALHVNFLVWILFSVSGAQSTTESRRPPVACTTGGVP